jgi:DNA polymerase-3 subunit beta
MKFTAETPRFVAALERLARIAATKSTIPILGGLRCEAAEGMVRLRATDLDRQIELEIPAKVSELGSAVVSADGLLKSLKSTTDEKVEFQTTEAVAKVKSGRRRAQIGLMAVDAFMEMPWPEPTTEFDVNADDVAIISRIAEAAASPKESRYYLAGVHFFSRGNKVLVEATDGNVLLRRELSAKADKFDNFILPVGMAADLPAIAANGGRAGFSDRGFLMEFDSGRINSKLIDGIYPDCDRVIPPDHTDILANNVDRDSLVSKASAVSFVSKYKTVVLKANSEGIEIRSFENGQEVEDILDGEWADERQDGVAFNSKYLSLIAGNTEAECICLRQAGPESPVRIDPVGYSGQNTSVIMPSRV